MLAQSLTVMALLAAKATATIYYAGVAESGGEFGVYSTWRTNHKSEEELLMIQR